MGTEILLSYLPLYQTAAILTLKIGLLGIGLAVLIGLVGASIQYKKIPFLSFAISSYIELSRNTPLLIQLFFI